MNNPDTTSLLDTAVGHARADVPQGDDTSTAQRALMDTLHNAEKHRSSRPTRTGRFALAVPALLAAFGTSLWVGGVFSPGGGAAFASVQEYFQTFTTLTSRFVLRMGDQAVTSMDVVVGEGGRARIEMEGSMTMVVNAEEGWMLTLLPAAKAAQWTEFTPDSDPQMPEQLGLLQELREFQGQATALEHTRTVHGESAIGYELLLDGVRVVLWAAQSDNKPIMMEGEYYLPDAAPGMRFTMDFAFDLALPASTFEPEIPAGYQWLGPPPAS